MWQHLAVMARRTARRRLIASDDRARPGIQRQWLATAARQQLWWLERLPAIRADNTFVDDPARCRLPIPEVLVDDEPAWAEDLGTVAVDPLLIDAQPWHPLRIEESWRRAHETDDQTRPDVGPFPICVTEYGRSGIFRVTDGHHRTARALLQGLDRIEVACVRAGRAFPPPCVFVYEHRADWVDVSVGRTVRTFRSLQHPTVAWYLSLGAQQVSRQQWLRLLGARWP